jgi:phosphoribosylaminoimidazole-succinocarboxamide synthase
LFVGHEAPPENCREDNRSWAEITSIFHYPAIGKPFLYGAVFESGVLYTRPLFNQNRDQIYFVTDTDIQRLLDTCLTEAAFPELPNPQSGKVRESYDLPDGRRVMIATDRQSAFDLVLAAVPLKGQVLNQTAMFWFEKTKDICPNHIIEAPDPNVVIARRLDMLPVEMVVRDYITGSTETSIWPMYERGERLLYGHPFPEGLMKNQKLPETIITPTTKAAQGEQDAPITAREIVEQGLLDQEQWDELVRLSLAVFARGREIAADNGLILVDTKYEFGLDVDGRITLADEILTPDSSRYWIADTYAERMNEGQEPENLDKEFLRLWIAGRCDPYNEPIPEIPPETLIEFSGKYVHLYEQVTSRTFEKPDLGIPIKDRIRDSLAKALPEFFGS